MINCFNIEKSVIKSKSNVICNTFAAFRCNTLICLSCPIKEMKSDGTRI